jgi:hypothetical protein
VNLAGIGRILAAQNPGEDLLVEISNALSVGKLPSDEAVRKLSEAVDAMLSEEDPQMRLCQLLHKLGLNNPEGRPPIDKNWKKQEQGERMARAYWRYWLLGCRKGEAREKVAAEFQRSGEFREGFPSPDTVQKNVKRYPQQAQSVFYYWRILLEPDKDEIKRAVVEVKRHLKNSR